jgi:hypothetical protein
MQLLLVSPSALSNIKIDLPDWCKSMMPGKPNTLYKEKQNKAEIYDTRNCCSKYKEST